MIRNLVLLLAVTLLCGCTPRPSTSKLQNVFAKERDAIEKLAEMLRDDMFCANENSRDPSEPLLISISKDNVCGYVLRKGKWYPSSPGLWMGPHIEEEAPGVSKDEMLVLTGISESRLEEYLALMKRVGVHNAALYETRMSSQDSRPEVSLFVYGEGFMHKGLSIYIVERDFPPDEDSIVDDLMARERRYDRYVPLADSWYLERLDQ